jgi:hypothetical protein
MTIARTLDYIRLVLKKNFNTIKEFENFQKNLNEKNTCSCGYDILDECKDCKNLFCLACDYTSSCDYCGVSCSDCDTSNYSYCVECDNAVCDNCDNIEMYQCGECCMVYCNECSTSNVLGSRAYEFIDCVGKVVGTTNKVCETCKENV